MRLRMMVIASRYSTTSASSHSRPWPGVTMVPPLATSITRFGSSPATSHQDVSPREPCRKAFRRRPRDRDKKGTVGLDRARATLHGVAFFA